MRNEINLIITCEDTSRILYRFTFADYLLKHTSFRVYFFRFVANLPLLPLSITQYTHLRTTETNGTE